MTDAGDVPVLQAEFAGRDAAPVAERGWYLYGIVGAGDAHDASSWLPESDRVDAPWSASDPLETIEYRRLAAIVQSISLAEFDPDAIRASADDVAWLEAIVRSHNGVIAQIHQRMPILPVRFGNVYARRSDVQDALEGAHDALLRQLEHVDGCDEWAVHVYADHQTIGEKVRAEHPSARRLRQEIAASRPGRAYLLQRRFADELAVLTDQALDEIAQAVYDRLIVHAVDAQLSAPAGSDPAGRREILRAAFLVSRVEADAFLTECNSVEGKGDGVGCTHSGPWPPYSFVTLEEDGT